MNVTVKVDLGLFLPFWAHLISLIGVGCIAPVALPVVTWVGAVVIVSQITVIVFMRRLAAPFLASSSRNSLS